VGQGTPPLSAGLVLVQYYDLCCIDILSGFFSRYGSGATPFDDQKAEEESEDLLSTMVGSASIYKHFEHLAR
jgi:hypothetical protein